jgi:hypothetical protein
LVKEFSRLPRIGGRALSDTGDVGTFNEEMAPPLGGGTGLVAPSDPLSRPFLVHLTDDYLGLIRSVVGGDVDTCESDDHLTLWFREDARSVGLHFNVNASALAATPVHGDVVVTAFDIDDVDNVGLSAGQMESLANLFDIRM